MHGAIGNAAAIGRATSFRLSVENEPDIENASWHQIAGGLERIEAGPRSFVVLVVDDQNFVQTLGNRDALLVEWRTKSEDMMSHYVLGRKGSGRTELQCVAGSAGNSEVVLAREVLDLTDALTIFRAFYEHQKVPEAYHLRDITKRNAARAVANLSPFGLVLLWQGWHSLDAPAAEVLERHLSREFPLWRQLLVFEGPLTPEYALALLGLHQNASADDVRRAYRERMLLYHPDNGGSSALAARLNEAAAILRKQNSRLASAISS
jgi:DnaJ domain